MVYSCHQCGKPITEGRVLIADVDGKSAYFHSQFDDLNSPPVGRDCPMDYLITKGESLMGDRVPFSEFERIVLEERQRARK